MTAGQETGFLSGAWLVLVQPGELADAIVRRLKELGADPVVVEHSDSFETVDATYFRVRAGEPEDTSRWWRDRVHEARGPIQGGSICGVFPRTTVHCVPNPITRLLPSLKD